MTVNVMFVSDNKYVKNLGVCSYSVLHNMCPVAERVRIFVMDCGITEENKARLLHQTARFDNAEIIFYNIEKQLDSVAPKVKTKWHRAIYGRLFLSELMKRYSDMDRILYLDCDLVMNRPVTDLLEMDMQGKCVAGVIDADDATRKQALGIDADCRYINSGVLLIDTARWMELDASNRIIDYINSFTQELNYPDQDAINYILSHDILILPPEYNLMWLICDNDIKKMLHNIENFAYTADEMHHALHNARVFHFAGHDMWAIYGTTPLAGRAFLKYKNLSDWRSERRYFRNPYEVIMQMGVCVARLFRGDYFVK